MNNRCNKLQFLAIIILYNNAAYSSSIDKPNRLERLSSTDKSNDSDNSSNLSPTSITNLSPTSAFFFPTSANSLPKSLHSLPMSADLSPTNESNNSAYLPISMDKLNKYARHIAMDTHFRPPVSIAEHDLDALILSGVQHIESHGERFNARAGNGQQAHDVAYTLLDPTDRLHLIRQPTSIKYFCRELLAYFKGSLHVKDGLSQASSVWTTLANEDGDISSNYGYYVFHQRIPEANNITQYEWVIKNLDKSLDSRRAFININQPMHKIDTSLDFPCTLGMQFFVKNDYLCCTVSSRSTDIYTGLPYDMGFFAFVTELVYKDLKERLYKKNDRILKLGHVTMNANFTQIYDKTRSAALALVTRYDHTTHTKSRVFMPRIENAQETLADIYQETSNSPIMQWIYKHAELPKS